MDILKLCPAIVAACILCMAGSVVIPFSRPSNFVFNTIVGQRFEELPAVGLVIDAVSNGVAQESNAANRCFRVLSKGAE